MDLTREEKLQRLSEFLNERWDKLYPVRRKEVKRYSIRKWANEMGLANEESLNDYMRGRKLPEAENKLKMAQYFGKDFFMILGESEADQSEWLQQVILDNVADLNEDDQKEIQEIVNRAKRRKGKKEPADHHHRQTA